MEKHFAEKIMSGQLKDVEQVLLESSEFFIGKYRDDSLNYEERTSYESRKPSMYHFDKMMEIKGEVENLNNLSDDELLYLKVSSVEESIRSLEKIIAEKMISRRNLEKVLEQVNKITVSKDNKNLIDYINDEINRKIDFNCSTKFTENRIIGYKNILHSLKLASPFSIRANKLNKLNERYKYHSNLNDIEIENCNKENNWYKKIQESLNS
jgi:hypothetical protein